MLGKTDDTGTTVRSTTIEDFLIVGTTQAGIYRFHTDICTKYKVKRLGRPTRYLGWKIRYGKNGTVQFTQTEMETVNVHNASMKNSNSKITPYAYGVGLNVPNGEETPRPELIKFYGTVVGDMR